MKKENVMSLCQLRTHIEHNTSESEMVATLQQSTNKISCYLWLTSHFKLSLIEDDNHIKSSSQLPFSTFKKLLAKLFNFTPIFTCALTFRISMQYESK